ncbi:MAG: uroporphyrinogen-III synthase [Candidatus Acidiferrales bacterium]
MAQASQPLEGKKIVVTRAPEQATELQHALEELGAQVLLLPTVGFAPPEDFLPLDAALARLHDFDWILFTSRNAVRYFSGRARDLRLDLASPAIRRPRVAAVGPATSQAASEEGFSVDFVPSNHSGEALAAELSGAIRGSKILLPRSDRAGSRLPQALLQAGAQLTEVVAYRTLAPESLAPGLLSQILRAEVDALVFSSPSAFQNLSDCVGAAALVHLSSRVQFAAIGPTTARALRDAGARVEMEANESSPAGIADAVAKFYRRSSPAARHA